MERDKLYRVIIFPKDGTDIRCVKETDDKNLAVELAKELRNDPKVHNVSVSEFELHFTQFILKTNNSSQS